MNGPGGCVLLGLFALMIAVITSAMMRAVAQTIGG